MLNFGKWKVDLIEEPKVLVVDDEADMAQVVADVVKKGNVSVKIAANGMEALKIVEGFSPDVIVTDLNMPAMRGDELLAILRENGYQKPVIILTGYGDDNLIAAAFRHDVFDFLEKPVSRDVLVSVIQKAIRSESERMHKDLIIQELVNRMVKAGLSVSLDEVRRSTEQQFKLLRR